MSITLASLEGEPLLTEEQAVEWLAEQGIDMSLRTLRALRSKGAIGWVRLRHGKSRVRFTRRQLGAFVAGDEMAPRPPRVRVPRSQKVRLVPPSERLASR